MKQPKTCFLITLTQVSDTGFLRQRVRRALELSGHNYLKRIVILNHPSDIELICHKMRLDEATDVMADLSYLIPEAYCELKEL